MRKAFVLFVLIGALNMAKAQKLSLAQLEHMLNQSMNEAEESLFLVGYSFNGQDSLHSNSAQVYLFTNRKNTIGTAKRVTKAVDSNEPLLSYLTYITYDRREFEQLRKQMVEQQFIRDSQDGLSENSNYTKDNLKVNFQVSLDEYENSVFAITLRNSHLVLPQKAEKKLNLRSILNKFGKEE